MQEQFSDLNFPAAGISLLRGFGDQQPVQMPNGEWGKTCASGINVRGFEPNTQRVRGGSRPGLSRYIPVAPVPGWIIQQLDTVTWVGGMPVQLSQSGRVVTLVSVSQGNVFTAAAGATSWTTPSNLTGNTPPLNFSGIVYSTQLNQKLWFADGINYCYFDPSQNAVIKWAATQGSLPADNRGNTPRLICTWRGRIVLSGLIFDPQNWFMSAVGDSTNFDYAPAAVTPTQAIAGNNSPVGIVGDVITSLCPYSDDTLVFFGDHTVYLMNGDPMAGGQIDRISDTVGAVWGIPWAKDPYGAIYFVSNQLGIYRWQPGQALTNDNRISQPIEQLLRDYDTGLTTVRVLWNDRFQGCHFFFSPTASPGLTTHLYYELRTGAWWQDQFASTSFDPLCCTIFDGNTPTDRVPLIGSWDGYVRAVDRTASTDDGIPFMSSVVLGPLNTANLDEITLKGLQAVLGVNSGLVQYDIFVGATCEQALASGSVQTGTWSMANGGRNLTNLIRRSAHGIYVKLSSTSQWAIEQIRASLEVRGKPFMRGR